MPIFPKIEKIAKDITISHFLLMFGYKLFSLYFPLFLVAKNFSIPQVGYTNFLIYLPIALFAPLVGFLNHKFNPAILATFGILGYGIYSLGMILFPNLLIFYFLQIFLGISAALFFVSSRTILMGSKLENPDRTFAWFYSAPLYADAIAPAVGALFIWKFNFISVFALSLVLQFFNAIFCFIKLRKIKGHLRNFAKFKESLQRYLKVFETIKERNAFPFIFISFLVLISVGFENAFFVLFLKNLGWSQNQILLFTSFLSLASLPISLFVIKEVVKFESERNIIRGSQVVGFFLILLGGLVNFLNFCSLFVIMIGKYAGGLTTSAGRSGLLTTKLKEHPEEAAAIDTIFSPLATALGVFLGGLMISPLGYPLIFALFGIFILIMNFTCQKSKFNL